MCSIHTIDTPVVADLLDRLDEFEHLGLGEPTGDLVEQQQSSAGWPAPWRVRAACGRAVSAIRRRRWPCRAFRPARARRSRPRPCCPAACRGVPNVYRPSTFSNTVRPSNGRGICAVPTDAEVATHVRRQLREVFAAEAEMLPVSGRRSPANKIEQRGLARAVGPDDAEGFALGNVEREVLDHLKRAEALRRGRQLAAATAYRRGDESGERRRVRHWSGSPATASCW